MIVASRYLVIIMLAIFFACGLIVVTQASNYKVVNLTQGPVLGYKANDADVFEFYGIPYATVPKGRNKYKGPLPPPVWTETLEAIDKGIICPQHRQELIIGKVAKEECLIANVFVPDTERKNLPVMVWVHGGAFARGHGNAYTPKQLVNSKRIVAVTFNYRLGPHGFLCLGTEDIPGNAGMKDQVSLLLWVKENIKNFGGNPDDVTIVGCSAGGASVDLLMLSKMTNGLFHRAIAMSGANVGVFGTQTDPIKYARNHAENINFHGEDFESLEEFYKNVSFEQLFSYSLELTDGTMDFVPCVERDVGEERFLDDSPVNIIKRGDYVRYPMLYGYTNMEGFRRMDVFDIWSKQMNVDFSQFLPVDLEFHNEDEKHEVANRVKEFYFGGDGVSYNNAQSYIDYYTDSLFVYAMQRSVTLQVESGNNNLHLFLYSFVDKNSDFVPYTNIQGANHCSESRAAMDEEESSITPEYKAMKEKMREVWLDFITTGNPTPLGSSIPTWAPSQANRSPCMDFGNTIKVSGSFEEKRIQFWEDIYRRYYRQPVPPYKF